MCVCVYVWALSSKYPASNKKKIPTSANRAWNIYPSIPAILQNSLLYPLSGLPSAVLSLSSYWCFNRDFVLEKTRSYRDTSWLSWVKEMLYIFLKKNKKIKLHYLWKVYSVIVNMIVPQYTNSVRVSVHANAVNIPFDWLLSYINSAQLVLNIFKFLDRFWTNIPFAFVCVTKICIT